MNEVDGHRIGSAEDSYLARRRAGLEEAPLTPARAPWQIYLLVVTLLLTAACALWMGWWKLFTEDPMAHARAVVAGADTNGQMRQAAASGGSFRGVSPGDPQQVLFYDALLGTLTASAWLLVLVGLRRGVQWVRVAGLVMSVITIVAMVLALSKADPVPVERTIAGVVLALSTANLVLLALPGRGWYDWRRHRPVADTAATPSPQG